MRLVLTALASILMIAPVPAQTPQYHYVQGGLVNDIFMLDATFGVVVEDGGRIRYTEDGGSTWTEADVPPNYRGFLRGVFFLDTLHAWAVGDGGAVLFSADKGKNWSLLNSLNPILNQMTPTALPAELFQIQMLDSFNGWAVGNDGVVVKTTNNWQTWTQASNLPGFFSPSDDPGDAYDLHFFSSQAGVVAADFGAIFYTLDGGVTWTDSTIPTIIPGNPAGHYLEYWRMDFSGQEGWVVGGFGANGGVLLHTLDGGVTWNQTMASQPLGGIAPPNCNLPTSYGVTTGAAGHAVAVAYASAVYEYSPTGTAVVPGITNVEFDQLNCSMIPPSGNPAWIQKEPIITNPDGAPPLNSVFSLSTTDIWLTGRFGILRRYAPGSGLWVDQGTQDYLRLTEAAFVNSSTGCVIGQGNKIKKTTNMGATWATAFTWNQPGANNHFGRDLDLNAAGLGLAVGTGGFLARTSDTGSTWSEELAPGYFPSIVETTSIAPSSSIAYVAGASGFVAKADLSGSGSLAWTDVSIPSAMTSSNILSLAFVDALHGYAAGTDMVVFETIDGGVTWVKVRVRGAVAGPDFLAIQTWGTGAQAIVVGTNGMVYLRTANRFDPVNLGAQAVTVKLNDVATLNGGTEFVAVGDEGTILSFDGTTWSQPKSQTNEPLLFASFDALNHGFVVGREFMILEFR